MISIYSIYYNSNICVQYRKRETVKKNTKGREADNMNNQTEWAETAANRSYACWGDFISSRVDVALERISRNPDYQELKEYQRKSEEEIDVILAKLDEEERDKIIRHYERETTVENYELEETYMLGVKDGIRFLSWLDIFQAKEWV